MQLREVAGPRCDCRVCCEWRVGAIRFRDPESELDSRFPESDVTMLCGCVQSGEQVRSEDAVLRCT